MAKKNDSKPKNKGGAKLKWFELEMDNKLDAIVGWAKQGYIDAEIAKMLGISEALLYRWKNDYPQFKAALLKGKEVANGELVNAAFRNATGYYVTITEPIKLRDSYGAETVEMVTYEKYIPANATQSIFMLKNRLPEEYRDKHEVKHDGQIGVTFVDDIPDNDEDE